MNTESLWNTGFSLLRLVAVAFSSFAAIITTMLPIYLYYSFPFAELLQILFLLLIGTILIHGFLTHVLNDYMDNLSGTDKHSPGILSGGSRVIQTGQMSPEALHNIGRISIGALLATVFLLLTLGYVKIGILLGIGVYSAVAYSLPSIRLSYYPLLGEWAATFPAIFFVGIGGVWLLVDQPPLWAFQNAVIISIFSLGWIMVHHIPDRFADNEAYPVKVTSVVWMMRKFGDRYSRLPALFYFLLTACSGFWLGLERVEAAIGIAVLSLFAIWLVVLTDISDHEAVSKTEKILLLLTMAGAIWLGIFI